jgi:predicted site-specific integrase-resolvase
VKRSRQPIFFETRGVAAKLGVKLATVRRYITTGRLKAATRIAAPPCPLVP